MIQKNKPVQNSAIITVGILEPVSCGREYILKAKEMGFRTILFSADTGERTVQERYRSQADLVVKIDTNDDDLVIQKCLELKAEIGLDAILPGFEYYVPLAAKVSHALGLPGLNPAQVNVLRFKHEMRQHLVAAGLRAPKFFYTEDTAGLISNLENFPYPVVVKPVDGSGSMNVVLASNLKEVIEAFETIAQNNETDMGRKALHKVLVEEYLDGPELSVEGYVERGVVHFLSITKKFLGMEPYFVELAHIVEADFNAEQKSAIEYYTGQVVNALGITLGPFHCELRLTINGPVLIEIGARLPGGQISELVGYAKDVDIYKIALNCYLGRANPKPDTKLKYHAGIKFLIREGMHTFRSVSGFEEYRKNPWVKELTMYYNPGDYIPAPNNWLGRIGYIIVTGDSYQQVLKRMEEFDRNVKFD